MRTTALPSSRSKRDHLEGMLTHAIICYLWWCSMGCINPLTTEAWFKGREPIWHIYWMSHCVTLWVSIRYGGAGPCADSASHNRIRGMNIQSVFRIFFSANNESYWPVSANKLKVHDQGNYKLARLKKYVPDGADVRCGWCWWFCTFRCDTHMLHKVKHQCNLLILPAPLYLQMDNHVHDLSPGVR